MANISQTWCLTPKLHTQINSTIGKIQKYAFLILGSNVPLNNVYLEIMEVMLKLKC